MNVNIWSDVRCPFCYIGKHKFEKALELFPNRDQIEVVWRSFELDPSLETNPEINSLEYFVESKGVSRTRAEQMADHVTQASLDTGIAFNFVDTVVANSFNAHRLIQFAKTRNLGGEVEEGLFKAHFTEGKNIDDIEALLQIGTSAGLGEKEVEEVLSSDAYAKEVREDEDRARSLGIHGVPFFVFDNRYAVSGAQSSVAFVEALEQSWSEFEHRNRGKVVIRGGVCSPDGNCGPGF